jgi:hypothetical protein
MSFSLVELHQMSGNEGIIRDNINRYTPFVVRSCNVFSNTAFLSSFANIDEDVDVSCIDKDSIRFNGNSLFREKVKIKLSAMAECFTAHMNGQPHWLDDTDLNLYLSQLPLWPTDLSTSKYIADCLQESFPSSAGPFPDHVIRLGLEVKQMNLWMNIKRAETNFHYDAYNNFLYVIDGSKEVILYPPNNATALMVAPAYLTSCNHSTAFPVDDHGRSSIKCKLQARDMLYIPEGWWHGVISEPCTMAINLWFSSEFQSFISSVMERTSHMQSYYLRRLSEVALVHATKTLYEPIEKKCSISEEEFEVLMLQYHGSCCIANDTKASSSSSNKHQEKRLKIDVALCTKREYEEKLFASLSMDEMMKLYPAFAMKVSESLGLLALFHNTLYAALECMV